MSRLQHLILAAILVVSAACSTAPAPQTVVIPDAAKDAAAARGSMAPAGQDDTPKGPARIQTEDSAKYQAEGPFPIDMSAVPAGVYDPFNKQDMGKEGGRAKSLISEERAAELRAESMRLEPSPRLVEKQLATQNAISLSTNFDSLDFNDCCGGGGSAPPDPELAVGPNHIIAVVNIAFAIYDKSGNLLVGPTTFSSFFNGTPGCSNTGVFDPNALYDESEDRFVIAIDGNGTDYCIAATTGSDPTGAWNRFAFPTDINGNFFDFPHAGVGLDAIYMGSNQFGATSFAEARVFAIEKAALYNGTTPTVVTRSTGNDGTPQPANLHGFNQGTWPTSGPHYIMTEVFDGALHTVWSWSDPFGANVLTREGDVDLNAATGITAGFPIDWPQAGSSAMLQGNDWRGQSTEYRNGNLWMSNNMACNPGGGTVSCVRWAQIDPTGPTVLNAGVLGTDGEYRTFPNVAANHCDDMAIGFTKGSSSTFPSVYMAGRESSDPAGTLQTEVLVKSGEVAYTSFPNDPAPHRWGDYTKMTVDPDGVTFWYLGEYSKETNAISKWGTYIGSFSFAGCTVTQPTCGDGVAEGNEVCDGSDLRGATCSAEGCSGGTLLCNATCDGFDTSLCTDCPVCDNDGVCEAGEDCNSCAGDCPSFPLGGADPNNGTCEAGDGETCYNSSDCNGRTNGNPSRRFCCGLDANESTAYAPDGCGDSRCSSGGLFCTTIPVGSGGSTCCGDGVCESPEDSNNCSLDCGAPPACGDGVCDAGESECSCAADCGLPPSTEFGLCTDGTDNDCDGLVDCDDSDCSTDAACSLACTDQGGQCDNSSECCPGLNCGGGPRGSPNRTCR